MDDVPQRGVALGCDAVQSVGGVPVTSVCVAPQG